MSRATWTFAAAVLIAIAGGVAASLAFPGGRLAVAADPVGADVDIVWKPTWEETLEANVGRWQEADDSRTVDRKVVALLQAMSERFPDQAERHVEAGFEIARRQAELGAYDEAFATLDALVEAHPGRADLAVRAMEQTSEMTVGDGDDRPPASTDRAEYAIGRIVSLARAGVLPASHPAVERALRLRFYLRYRQEQFWGAARALDALEAMLGPDEKVLRLRGELYLSAGRMQDALRIFEGLSSGEDDDRDVRNAREIIHREGMSAPSFARDLGIEMQWAAMRQRAAGADTQAVQSLLAESAQSDGLVPWLEKRHASVWAWVDRLLLEQPPEVLAPLRRAQQRSLGTLLGRGGEAARADADVVLSAYRRYPWAQDVHEALVELGEHLLRRGQADLAFQAFDDARAHAADPAIRDRAQVGLWLAVAARAAGPEAVEAAFGGTPPDATFPWMGETRTAGSIKERLLARFDDGGGPSGGPRAGDLKQATLRLPPVTAWLLENFVNTPEEVLASLPFPLGEPQAWDGKVLVSAPSLLACFGEDPSRPLWTRSPQSLRWKIERRDRRDTMTLPGPFRAACGDGRVVSRWDLDPSLQYLKGLAAFDARTGRMLWSTAGDPVWETLGPVSDPVLADGRVYVLATHERFSELHGRVGTMGSSYLLCLDADSGETLWQRSLAAQNPGLALGQRIRGRRGAEVDLVHYGNPVTVHRGSVYCSTNLGFVARCDAHDGLVRWARSYPRVRVNRNLASVADRQGASPVVVGRHAVFLPRDYAGAFALDTETGDLLWDVPFVPSDAAIGTRNGAALMHDGRHVVAVDAATGEVRWSRRFDADIIGRPVLSGGSIYVGTARQIVRLDAETGLTRDRAGWAGGEPPLGFTLRGGSLLAVRPEGVVPGGLERPGDPDAAAKTRPGVPMRSAWRMVRRRVKLHVPPPEAGIEGRVYVESQGFFECVGADARGRVHWGRFLAVPPVGVAWAEGTVLLIFPDRVVGLDALGGEARWQRRVPFAVYDWSIDGRYLAVGDPRHTWNTGVIDVATGELKWVRRFVPDGRDGGFAAADGHVHIVAEGIRTRNQGHHLMVRAEDGRVVASRGFPAVGADWPRSWALEGGTALHLQEDGTFVETDLATGRQRRHTETIDPSFVRSVRDIRIEGPWVRFYARRGDRRRGDHRHYIFRRGDPDFFLRLDRLMPGTIQGDRLFEPPYNEGVRIAGEGVLPAIDLPTGRETRYTIPRNTHVVDIRERGGKLWLLLGRRREDEFDATPLELAIYEPGRPEARASQIVPYATYDEVGDNRRNQLFLTDEAALITGPTGVRAFVAAGPGEPTAPPRRLVHHHPGPIQVDGSLADWPAGIFIPLRGEGGARGTLGLLHSGETLYLAVTCDDRYAVPSLGRFTAGAGDWLEVGLTTRKGPWQFHIGGAYRWGIGVGEHGETVVRSLEPRERPSLPEAVAAHDPVDGRMTYEVAIPLSTVTYRPKPWREAGLSVAVWDDRPGGGGPTRRLTWGEGILGDEVVPAGHEAIYLHPMSAAALQAATTVVESLPMLPETFDVFRELAEARATSPASMEGLLGEFLRRRRGRVTAGRLVTMTRMLHAPGAQEAVDRVLALAERTGVPDDVRRRFEWSAKAYLSQWMYLVPSREGTPRFLVLELDAGQESHSGIHDIALGKYEGPTQFTFRDIGRALPPGTWHELTLPLWLFEAHDKPIAGITYQQQGGGPIVYDRAAIVTDGSEEVLFDDPADGSRIEGEAAWTDTLVKHGTGALRTVAPDERYKVKTVSVTAARPAIGHLPPSEGPQLVQWVYLDPADPPESVFVHLRDSRGWRYRFIWGAKVRRGRWMGELPEPGAWHALRMPLDHTPLATRPITGIAFERLGGRVVWDRTVLAGADGSEHVLLDEQTPPVPPDWKAGEWHSYVDRYGPGTACAEGKVGIGLFTDGRRGYLEVPHSPDLEPERLTVEAWVHMYTYPEGGDTREWIVSKSRNEATGGHYALVIGRDKPGAYLHIEDGGENPIVVWGEDGSIKLDTWHHLAMTYDGADLVVYLDGKEARRIALNRKRTRGEGPLTIARRPDGYTYYRGFVDEVRVLGRALSADEIAAHYRLGSATPEQAAREARSDPALALYVGFDEHAAPSDPAADWHWIEQPVKSGSRAHTGPAGDGYASHFALLAEPATAHLPFDPARAARILRQAIPALGPTEQATRFFHLLLEIDPSLESRIEHRKWFVQALPRHPDTTEVLGGLLDDLALTSEKDPRAAVEAFLAGADLPRETLYDYHRRYTHRRREFVQQWLVLGPLPDAPTGGDGPPEYPSEAEPIDPADVHPGLGMDVRWTRVDAAPGRFVNLAEHVGAYEHVTAYAACWVRSDRRQRAVVEFGSDDGGLVWVNRRLVLSGPDRGEARAGAHKVPVELGAGWNEVLIENRQSIGRWGFYFELVAPEGRGPLEDIEVSTTPPGLTAQKNGKNEKNPRVPMCLNGRRPDA